MQLQSSPELFVLLKNGQIFVRKLPNFLLQLVRVLGSYATYHKHWKIAGNKSACLSSWWFLAMWFLRRALVHAEFVVCRVFNSSTLRPMTYKPVVLWLRSLPAIRTPSKQSSRSTTVCRWGLQDLVWGSRCTTNTMVKRWGATRWDFFLWFHIENFSVSHSSRNIFI